MPKGPQGQARPVGTVPCAMHVAKLATGEIQTYEPDLKVTAGYQPCPDRPSKLTVPPE